jgi:hypothetical protein
MRNSLPPHNACVTFTNALGILWASSEKGLSIRSSADEDGYCAPAARKFLTFDALGRGDRAQSSVFSSGVVDPKTKIAIAGDANAPIFERNAHHRIKRKLQNKKGGIMTGAGTVTITGTAEATASDAESSSVVTPARACAGISSGVFCINSSQSAFTTGVRGAVPPPTG